ncbi:DUF6653 family protein [Actinomycetospora sp. CA-053990]|uniref:DUF6653 family protein n=1 Tax=Actinomycetospora sp. CA-053990 TaxID=3239891 RepID=UPI003D8B84A3
MTTSTPEGRIAGLFGLRGEQWMRHANPWSVWVRFAVLPLLALAAWSRVWIGWWAVLAGAVALVFMVVEPLLFPPPRSTRNWASKGVFGERILAEGTRRDLPAQFRTSRVPVITTVWQTIGLAGLVVGLVRLDLLLTLAGLCLCVCAKAWYIDRAVLLFEDVKTRDPECAAWEYPTPDPRSSS